MAHHKSTIKSVRQIKKRTEANNLLRSRFRTFVKKVELAIAAGNKKDAMAAVSEAESALKKAANRSVIKKETVSRKVSRLHKRIKAL